MVIAGVSSAIKFGAEFLSQIDSILQRLEDMGCKVDSRLGKSIGNEFDMAISIHADPSCRDVFGEIECVIYSMEREGTLKIREVGCKTQKYGREKRFSPMSYDLFLVHEGVDGKRIGIVYDEIPEI